MILPVIIVTAGSVVALFLDFLGEIAIFQYINVPFPANFEAFVQFFGANIFPNLFEKAYDESDSVISTNGKFEEYECSRVFLDNCGGGLDKEFLAITIIIVTSLLALTFKSCPRVHSFICKVRDSYRWNGLLAFYIGDFQEYFVFTLLQFKESAKPLISLIIGILLVVSYFVWFLYLSVALNRRKKTAKKLRDFRRPSRPRPNQSKALEQKEEEEEIGDIPESMNMVLDEFVTKYWYSRNFLLMMCFQNVIIGFILVFLQNWGTIQAGLYSYMAIFYGVLVLGAFRPFKEKSQTVTFTISQIVKGTMGCLALALGLDEKWMLFSDNQRDAVGIALITLAGVGVGSNALLAVGMIVKTVVDYCRKFMKRKQEKKISSKSRIESPTLVESRILQSNYVESQNDPTENLAPLSGTSTKQLNPYERKLVNIIPRKAARFSANRVHQHQHQQHKQQRQPQRISMSSNHMDFDIQGIIDTSNRPSRKKPPRSHH